MNRVFSFIMIICLVHIAGAQQSSDVFQRLDQRNDKDGVVSIVQHAGIADMVKMHIDQNKRMGGIEGWRINLYSGSGSDAKKEAQEIKGKAMSEFPDEKVYLIYNAPFWRVRVGDFRDKSESLKLYYKLKREFSSCYPVKDDNVNYKGF